MSTPLQSAIRQAIEARAAHLLEADFAIAQAAALEGEALMSALVQGAPLERPMLETFNQLIERHIAGLTWQGGLEPVPRPPWVEVGPRLRSARMILEEAGPYLDNDVRSRVDGYVRCAEELRFRADWEVEAAELALRRGEVVRLPSRRPVGVSLGPTSWSAVQGAFPRRRLLMHLGRDPRALTLMLRQDQALAPRRLELFARAAGRTWVPIDYEAGTTTRRPIEGLERIAGDPRCAGWHVAVLAHRAMWSVVVEDLQSPLGVYVEVPEHINDDS